MIELLLEEIDAEGTEFPEKHGNIYWLHDQSGGKGKVANIYPRPNYNDNYVVGYAGGINPDNVKEILEKIPAADDNFWIDMENGIRTDDWFDIDKAIKVLENVYGRG